MRAPKFLTVRRARTSLMPRVRTGLSGGSFDIDALGEPRSPQYNRSPVPVGVWLWFGHDTALTDHVTRGIYASWYTYVGP